MNQPRITIKFAETLDGKIAAENGSSKWISGPASRRFAHGLRARHDAVLVGIGTVLKDDPALSVRLVKGRDPAKIVVDPRLRIPLASQLIKNARHTKTIIFTTSKAPGSKIKSLEKKGIIVIPFSSKAKRIDPKKMVRILYAIGIKSIMVEGGRGIITSFLKSGLKQKVIAIISPKILGSGIDSVGYLGIKSIKKALNLRLKSVTRLGNDVVLRFKG